MSTSQALRSSFDLKTATASQHDRATVARFLKLAVRGLVPMFDESRQMFCFSLKKYESGMVQEGISPRYTMMCLMGLHRLEQGGGTSPFEKQAILDALFADLSWVDNVGDLGVLLWTCGIVCPERFGEVQSKLQPQTALTRYQDAKRGFTMELAWFLTGLSYWAQVEREKSPFIEPIASHTYKQLIKNQGDRGFFGHLSTTGSLAGVARGRTGSFADQVYPIYGMAHYAKAFHSQEAAKRALKTAIGICEEQGAMGQWWWHYDSPGGRVTDGYPVFSVHQHAMAPFTLFGLGDAIQHNFDSWIYKGLRWINSHNELSFDMEDDERSVIWRCIYRSRRSLTRYLQAGMGKYSERVQAESKERLKVLFECRPYELGWLLYAFGNRANGEQRSSNNLKAQ